MSDDHQPCRPDVEFIDSDEKSFSATTSSALFQSGILYIAIFVPLCWIYAERAGKSRWSVLLFADAPTPPQSFLGFPYLPSIGIETDFDIAFWFALATAYGVMNLVMSLLLTMRLTWELVIGANGFVFGYFLAWAVLGLTSSISPPPMHVAFAQILYIYCVYVLVEYIKSKILGNTRRHRWLRMMLDGMFGLTITFFLVVGRQSALELLIGPLYLFTSFLSMIVIESTLVRIGIAMLLAFSSFEEKFQEWQCLAGLQRLRTISAFTFSEIGRNVRLPIDDLFDAWHRLSETPRSALSMAEKWVIDPRIFLAMFILSTGFPLVIAASFLLMT